MSFLQVAHYYNNHANMKIHQSPAIKHKHPHITKINSSLWLLIDSEFMNGLGKLEMESAGIFCGLAGAFLGVHGSLVLLMISVPPCFMSTKFNLRQKLQNNVQFSGSVNIDDKIIIPITKEL